MKRVYKRKANRNSLAILSLLISLFFIGVFIFICIDPFYADGRLSCIVIIGIPTIGAVLLSYVAIDEKNDTVTLTDNRIKFHLHRQTFPYSLKAIDDEVRWKDIRNASFVDKQKTTFLILTLASGEIKEYGIGHMDRHLQYAIESRFTPDVNIEEEEGQEDEAFVAGSPGPLEQAKKKAFFHLLVSASAGIIGILLIAVEIMPVLGYLLDLNGLVFGALSLWAYRLYNASHIDPAPARKGMIITYLGALLLICILVATIYFMVQNYNPA